MRLLRKLRRFIRNSRITQRLTVWTKDHRNRVFCYDIRICPTPDPSRYLVRFDRKGPSNNMRVHRIMREPQVRELQLRSC